jgi:TolB-like protein
MNARAEMLVEEPAVALAQDHVSHAVRLLLASPVFTKAPRMCQLLSFLIEKKLSGKENEITEYAIGMEVFRRDARLYDTLLDPVVRVQIGRLRERLAAYYASPDAPLRVRVGIPLGSYVPTISQGTVARPLLRRRQLELAPLRDLTGEHHSNCFVSGVEEELGSRLFHAFGALIQLRDHDQPMASPPGCADTRAAQRLEGSIRVEKNHVRASMRLLDTGAGHIAWLSQFDCHGELGMNLQEELAGAICDKLQRYLADY